MDNIGEILRQTRLERGVSLDQIETDTKIKKKYILNLENEEWNNLPGRVYIKGFLKTYSAYLGLNEQAILDRFEVDVAPVPLYPVSPPARQRRNIELNTKPKRKVILLMSVLALIFLAAIQIGYHKWVAPNRGNQPPITTEPIEDFLTEEQETTEAPTQAVRTGIDMILTVLQDECWLQIKNEGELLYEGIMSSGQTISYDNLTRLELVAGNPSVAELILNDMNLGVLGERGTVARKTYILENGELKEEVRR